MIVSNGEITIIDVNDGLNASLSQTSLIVPCDASGNVISLSGLNTTMQVYLGETDDSANWNFYISNIGTGITYSDSLSNSLRTGTGQINGVIGGANAYVVITSFSATDNSYVEITARKFGKANFVKRFDLVKSKPGIRGTVTAQIKDQLSWTDDAANAYFAANYNNLKLLGDIATEYGAGFAQTRIWTGTVWQLVSQIVDGNLLVTGTVTTGSIAVGAVGTDQITAKAITTDKILVTGTGPTINKDPNTTDITAWSGSGISIYPDSTSPVGKTVLRCVDSGAAVLTSKFEIDKSKNYRLRIWVKQVSGTTTAYLTAIFKDNTGNLVVGTGWPATYKYNYFGLIEQQPPSTWTEYIISFGPNETAKIPDTATYLQVGIWSNYTGGSGIQQITGIRVVEKASADLIVDGAITSTKLATNSISVGTTAIQNGAIINAMISDATIDTAKIRNLSANKITAGDIAVGQTVASGSKYSDGTPKWVITGDGVTNFTTGVFSGSLSGANVSGATGTFSGLLSSGSVDFSSCVGTTTNYLTAAVYTITVPANMTSLRLNIIGGGGGGGGGGSSVPTGGGAGGGAASYTTMTLTGVIPGTSYTLKVGNGGVGGTNFTQQYADSTHPQDFWYMPANSQGVSGESTTFALTSNQSNIIASSTGGAGGVALNMNAPYSGATGTHTGTNGNGTGAGIAAVYLSGAAGGNAYANSGSGGGGGYGADAGTSATNGGNGGAGKAIIEFFNPTGAVLRAEMNTLKSELRNQNLTIS